MRVLPTPSRKASTNTRALPASALPDVVVDHPWVQEYMKDNVEEGHRKTRRKATGTSAAIYDGDDDDDEEVEVLPLDKEAIWKELSNKLDWDINSEEIGQVVRRITRDHRPASSGYRREQARLRPALTQLVSSLHTQAAWCKWRDKKNSANLYRSMCKSVERSIPIHPGALVAPFVTSSTDADAVGKGVPNSRLGRNDDARGFRHNK